MNYESKGNQKPLGPVRWTRLHPEDDQAIDQIAAEEDTKPAHVIRRLVAAGLRKERPKKSRKQSAA